jgi:SpoVK/Ycf46/Vps4 family AAA+-type ATPase
MLAKAVARDSGATVLNISGSEIRQMYVGESEKVVKAVFTLAQKLSPCIVFIDEADSLLGTRAVSETGNTSRRDTINQFLLEWDGMNERNVFLMVATNRPFDLDDAVLRRLPRRLLVDLPTKEDRQSILSLHLRDEELDDSVDVAVLAEQTPFYSGSDIKNVVVSAALACVKEENDVAAKAIAEGNTDFKHPPRRRLTRLHFDKALEEIAASISEDMSTLAAMRKWDERYGDRKGRKKKTTWGFIREEVKESNARVRN